MREPAPRPAPPAPPEARAVTTAAQVRIPLDWVEFFRRNLVSPVEFGGALDFDPERPDAVDSAALMIGDERSVSLLNRREEIGVHTHPVSRTGIFAPSGKDYAALLSAASRYYGGWAAPNQQVSVVFAGNGVYAIYPTAQLLDRLDRVIDAARRAGPPLPPPTSGKKGAKMAVKEAMGHPIEALMDQALHTDRFIVVDVTAGAGKERKVARGKGGGSGGGDIGTARGRLGPRTVYEIRAPRGQLARWDAAIRGMVSSPVDTAVAPYAPLAEVEGWADGSGLTTLFAPEADADPAAARAIANRLEAMGARVSIGDYPLIPSLVALPEVTVDVTVGTGAVARGVAEGDLAPGVRYRIRFPSGRYRRDQVEAAVRRAWESVRGYVEEDPLSRERWAAAILGRGEADGAAIERTFLDSLADSMRDSLSVNLSTLIQAESKDISDVVFDVPSQVPKGGAAAATEVQRLSVPPWAMDPRNPKMALIRDTARALGYRLDFFPVGTTPVLEVRPVVRAAGKVTPFGLKREPVRVVARPAFAKGTPLHEAPVRSYQFE